MTKPDATTVVDALLKTRLFSLAKMRLEGYYRPVQCLKIHWKELAEFVVKPGPPFDPIPTEKLLGLPT